MPKFLIEVSQESDALARKRINDSVQKMGSHFATRAGWIRKAGVCTGTMIVETDDKWGPSVSFLPTCDLMPISSSLNLRR